MKRAFAITAALAVIFAAMAGAQTATPAPSPTPAPNPMAAPTPPPELKKLDYFVGTWKSTGELKPGPMGPGGKFTELTHTSWMEGRFFLVERTTGGGVMGHLVEIAYLGYNVAEKSYSYDAFNNFGEAEHAKGNVEGDTWTWTSTENMGGHAMKGRFTITVASPTSYTFKFEIAAEGGSNYTTVVEGKATKVSAASASKGTAKK
jgi:hypothetical protein